VCIFEAVAFGGRAGERARAKGPAGQTVSVARARACNKNDVVDVGSGYI
jgi:hypothetical protein